MSARINPDEFSLLAAHTRIGSMTIPEMLPGYIFNEIHLTLPAQSERVKLPDNIYLDLKVFLEVNHNFTGSDVYLIESFKEMRINNVRFSPYREQFQTDNSGFRTIIMDEKSKNKYHDRFGRIRGIYRVTPDSKSASVILVWAEWYKNVHAYQDDIHFESNPTQLRLVIHGFQPLLKEMNTKPFIPVSLIRARNVMYFPSILNNDGKQPVLDGMCVCVLLSGGFRTTQTRRLTPIYVDRLWGIITDSCDGIDVWNGYQRAILKKIHSGASILYIQSTL
jgi:hypothetical protein